MTRSVALAITLAAAFSACRGSDNPPGDDVQGDAAGGDVTIQEVQNDAMAPGTPVTLKGVVVTTIDTYGGKTGDFWVEEPGGGERSGVHVFGAPLAMVGAIAVGDLVDITGAQKDEFAYAGSNGVGGDTSGRSITELKPVNGGMMTVTKTGTGTVPAPVVVDALAIGQKATQAERDAEWEKWEGVLVTVMNIPALNRPACVGTACNDDTLNKFTITGGAVAESSLAPFPGYMPAMGTTKAVPSSIASGECLMGITGVVDYFFDYLLLNTSTAAVVTGGTGCPVAEGASHAVCSDNIDNDGNGFSDCMDNGCIIGDSACRTATTISAVRAATPTGAVELQNVYVTAIGRTKFDLWVSSSLTAAPNEGIYVRATGVPALDSSIVVGAKVNVIGKVTEFNNDATGDPLTQISRLSLTLVAAPTVPPTPVLGQTVASLLVPATGEPYEGVLVTLTNVKITTVGDSTAFYVSDLSQKTTVSTAFKADDDVARMLPAEATKCYSTITGIWSYSVFDNRYLFFPRATTIAGTVLDGVLAVNQADCN